MWCPLVQGVIEVDAFYPTINPDAQGAFKASADELLEGLLTGYQHTSEIYRANPTPGHWRALVQAHAAWRVAFRAENYREP